MNVDEQLKRLGQDIRVEMAKQNLNQSSLSEKTGLDKRTIKRVMEGNGGVSIGLFVIVAQSLGKYISVGDL